MVDDFSFDSQGYPGRSAQDPVDERAAPEPVSVLVRTSEYAATATIVNTPDATSLTELLSFVVNDLSPADFDDAYEVHAFMAAWLTERAVPHLTDHDIGGLRALDEQMRVLTAAGAGSAAGDVNHETHRRIYQAGRSPLLVRFLRETTPLVVRRHDPDVPGWEEIRLEGHHELLDALQRRDAPAAATLMAEHIRDASRHAHTKVRPRGDATRPSRSRSPPKRRPCRAKPPARAVLVDMNARCAPNLSRRPATSHAKSNDRRNVAARDPVAAYRRGAQVIRASTSSR